MRWRSTAAKTVVPSLTAVDFDKVPEARAAFLVPFTTLRYPALVHADEPTLADLSDLADALAYALRFQGRKRVHNADKIWRRSSASALSSIWNGPAL